MHFLQKSNICCLMIRKLSSTIVFQQQPFITLALFKIDTSIVKIGYLDISLMLLRHTHSVYRQGLYI